MIIVRLMGGLGNQMFQYAFGRSLSLKHNQELVLDQSLLLDKSISHAIATHRDFDLDIFKNLKFRWATEQEVFLYNGDSKAGFLKKLVRRAINVAKPKQLVIQNKNMISKHYFEVNTDTCFVGRWQSYQFFEAHSEQIRKDFKLKKPFIQNIEEPLQEIIASTSVCLHVRRGDLITSPVYSKTIGTLDLSYYTGAVNHMNNLVTDPTYFVFSDDIEWCKQHIKINKPIKYVDNNFAGEKAEGHLYLMSQCKHFIISNSTFAWWGAYLSEYQNKQVVYPKNWFKDDLLQNPEMSPLNWIAV